MISYSLTRVLTICYDNSGLIELSDKDLSAIANSRAWQGKYLKKVFVVTVSIFFAVFVAFTGWFVYLALSWLPPQIPSPIWEIGILYMIGFIAFLFIGGSIRSRQIMKELKKERDK